MGNRFDECRAHVLGHADYLIDRIKAGELNASAFEGLMRAHVLQPAYDPTFRGKLMDLAMERIDGRPRPAQREEAP